MIANTLESRPDAIHQDDPQIVAPDPLMHQPWTEDEKARLQRVAEYMAEVLEDTPLISPDPLMYKPWTPNEKQQFQRLLCGALDDSLGRKRKTGE
jgi:hypothetical protein